MVDYRVRNATFADIVSRPHSGQHVASGRRYGPLGFLLKAGTLTVACGVFAGATCANPLGPKLISGQATFDVKGASLTVHSSPGTVINWQSFSIGAQETASFVQASADSVVVNRVTGGNPSTILGMLSSNGHLVLINSAGVIFGKSGQVDAAGLVISTLDRADPNWKSVAGHYETGGTASTIDNAGSLHAVSGDLVLMAPSVTNSGSAVASSGSVILAAASRVDLPSGAADGVRIDSRTGASAENLGRLEGTTVAVYGTDLIQAGVVQADASKSGVGHVILSASHIATFSENSTTSAPSGSIRIQAQGDDPASATQAASVVVAHGALVSAAGLNGGSVTVDSGHGLASVGGVLTAAGQGDTGRGGVVEVLGNHVVMAPGSQADVSGNADGGTVRIGSAASADQGLTQQSLDVRLDAGSQIDASSKARGQGGLVIVNAAQEVTINGAIDARGGPSGGRGGQVETGSSADLVTVGTMPSVSARDGQSADGTWVQQATVPNLTGSPATGASTATDSTPAGGAVGALPSQATPASAPSLADAAALPPNAAALAPQSELSASNLSFRMAQAAVFNDLIELWSSDVSAALNGEDSESIDGRCH